MSPLPDFYDPARIGTLFYPDLQRIAEAATTAQLRPAAEDSERVHLLIIDMQVDFCHGRGALHVPGALEDIRRLIEFIYRNAERITRITCSLDSHLPYQIFHPAWWADTAGNHPAPFTLITYADIESGRWRPLREPERSIAYVKHLEERARKTLTIWPYHTLIGSPGHALDAELFSAVFWHSMARRTQPEWLTKGSIPLTEHYSIVQPEVPMPEEPLGDTNTLLLRELALADRVIVAGEAETHCILESVEDLVEAFGPGEQLGKLVFLRDCTSPVIHPEVDFHAIALGRFAEFEAQGVQFRDSTDPLLF